eukprot:366028-Chlamydomonas_euryale.AAC.34
MAGRMAGRLSAPPHPAAPKCGMAADIEGRRPCGMFPVARPSSSRPLKAAGRNALRCLPLPAEPSSAPGPLPFPLRRSHPQS